MRLSEIQNKDVVDISTGQRIGNVIDIDVNYENGNIIKIIIYDKKSFINIFKSDNEISISWEQIKKIGEDVILIGKNN